MVVDRPVSDELYLGDAGDGLEVRVEDRLFVGPNLLISMPVSIGPWIECLNNG